MDRMKILPTDAEIAQTYTALIRQDEGWWIGWVLEVRGVTCQERTRGELLDTLKITLREIVELDISGTAHRTESEVERVKISDMLEFGVPKISHGIQNSFEEIKISIRNGSPASS